MSNSRRDEPREPKRKAGRSFTEPERPLGEGILERSDPGGGGGAETANGSQGPKLGHGLSERAKAIGVLRKAEEFMASGNPPGDTEESRARALELACGRCGVTVDEYREIVRGDEELIALQRNVMDAARRRAVRI